MSKSYKTINKRDFKSLKEEITKQTSIVLLHAEWCGHCQIFKPIWEKVAKDVCGKQKSIKLYSMESEVIKALEKKDSELFKFIVRDPSNVAFPTLVIFKKGEKKVSVSVHRGAKDEKEFKKVVMSLLPKDVKDKMKASEKVALEKVVKKAAATKKVVTKKTKKAGFMEQDDRSDDMGMYELMNEQIHTVPRRSAAESRENIDKLLAKYLGLKL